MLPESSRAVLPWKAAKSKIHCSFSPLPNPWILYWCKPDFLKACIFKNRIFYYIRCYCLVSVSHFCLAGYNLENKVGKEKAGISAIIFSSTVLSRDLSQSPAPLCYSLIKFMYFKLLWKSWFQEISCNVVLGTWFCTKQCRITKISEVVKTRLENKNQGIVFPLLHPFTLFPFHHTYFQNGARCRIHFPVEMKDYKSVLYAFTVSITLALLPDAFLVLLFP